MSSHKKPGRIIARKGALFFQGGIEILGILLLIAGFFMGSQIKIIYFDYALVFVAGMFWGRFIYFERQDHFIPFIIAGTLFIVGFIVGNKTAEDIALALTYYIAIVISFKLHQELIRDR